MLLRPIKINGLCVFYNTVNLGDYKKT